MASFYDTIDSSAADLRTAAVAYADISGTTIVASGSRYGDYGEHFSVLKNGRLYLGAYAANLGSGLAIGANVQSGGNIYVYSGGTTSDTVISGGGYGFVYTGGSACATTVESSGFCNVFSGAVANGVNVNSGGTLVVNTYASATGVEQAVGGLVNAVVLGGNAAEISGINELGGFSLSRGVASGFVVYSGGAIQVSSGGKVYGVEQKVGGNVNAMIYGGDAVTVVSGNNELGSFTLAGGVADGFVIYAGGHQNLYAGGSAVNTVVFAGGNQYVSGGLASGTVVSSGGFQALFAVSNRVGTITGRGSASATEVLAGGNITFSGGVGEGAVVRSGGIVYVATGSAVNLVQYSGAIVRTTVDGGAGAYITGINVDGRFSMESGRASGFVVDSGATQNISSGGVAYNTTINNFGEQYVYADGLAVSNTVNVGGKQYISSGVASATTIAVSGGQYINDNSLAVDTVIAGSQRIAGGVAIDTMVLSGGRQQILSMGLVSNTVVESGGRIQVYKSGTLSNAVISGGGTLTVISGGIVSGHIDIDLSWAESQTTAIINNWALLGTDDLGITVNGTIAMGGYCLAAVADGFAGSMALSFNNNATTISLTDFYIDPFYERFYGLSVDSTGMLTLDVTTGFAVLNKAESTQNVCQAENNFARDDYGVIWNSSTMVGASTVYCADAGGSGNSWLSIENGANLGSVVVYGLKSGDYTGTVNVHAEAGTIGSILGGAQDSDASVGNVNLHFGGTSAVAEVAGVVYGGGRGSVEGNVMMWVHSGAVLDLAVCGGPVQLKTASGNYVGGDISIYIDGGTLVGDLIGAGRVNVGESPNENSGLVVSGGILIDVSGGEFNSSKSIYAGGFVVGNGNTANTGYDITVSDGVSIVWDGGTTRGGAVNGRGVFLGACVADNGRGIVSGGANFTLAAGTVTNLFGGGWSQDGGESVIGSGDSGIAVSIAVSSGRINNIFGGGAHADGGTTLVSGNVEINIAGGIISNVYAGGQQSGDVVEGNSTITVTGSTDYATTRFFGVGYDGSDTVNGKSELVFSDYYASIGGTVTGFDLVEFSGGGTTVFADGAAVNSSIENWCFNLTGRAESEASQALLEWSEADFTEDAVTIAVNSIDNSAVTDWLIAAGGGTTTFDTTAFNLVIDELSYGELALNEAVVGGEFDGWRLYVDENSGALRFGLASAL